MMWLKPFDKQIEEVKGVKMLAIKKPAYLDICQANMYIHNDIRWKDLTDSPTGCIFFFFFEKKKNSYTLK